MNLRRLLLSVVLAAALAGGTAGTAAAGTYPVLFANGQGCGLFTASPTPEYQASCGQAMTILSGGIYGLPASGTEENFTAYAPLGLTIVGASASFATPGAGANGWGSGDFFSGSGSSWNYRTSSNESPISSSYWGFQLLCNHGGASCGLGGSPPQPEGAEVSVGSVTLTVSEAQAPSISPAPGSLFGQGGWVWNPAGDPWPVGASASDPSGACTITATVAGQPVNVENQTASKDEYAWQQCANGTWTTGVDTRQYVAGSGALPISLTATNAAGNASPAISNTVEVDDRPVSVSLGTPNDANPTSWVNHAVQVTASASAGPSGINQTRCSIDGAQSFAYPAGGFNLDGDGAHTVSCTVQNNALDPQGAHNSGTASEQIRIDEAPPVLAFAPVNPADPDELAVNTSDNESGVAGGSITVQGPHQTAATPIATTLTGGQLLAHFDDAGKNGNYTFTATSCDAVGNCASTQEALHFPIRLGSQALVSFRRIYAPARTLIKRIRVGGGVRTITRHERIHGRRRVVKRAVKTRGRVRHVRIRVRRNRRCGSRIIHVRAGRRHHRRRRRVRACRVMRWRTTTRSRQRLGHRIRLYGLVRTKQGQPIADATVRISTRPDDRGGRYRRVATTTTNRHGRWEVKLPGGPSRTIRAFYTGSNVVEPATVHAHLTVPAEIRLHITPHLLPWSHTMHLRGHLVGRYVPHDGVALRLLVHYPHARGWTVLQALRTNRRGAFHFGWDYNGGRGVATYPFRVASTATETDYPYAAGASRPVRITFGRATPVHHHRRRHHHHHHRLRHRHDRHRHHHSRRAR